MTVPARLSRTLRDVFGAEAAEEMMALMMEMATQRRDILAAIQRIDDRVQGLEVRLTKEIGAVGADLTKAIGAVRADLTKEIGNVKADLMKWSFLFWVGAVSAIAMLAGVLQR